MSRTPEVYFAYGSNLDAEQMRSRCPSAVCSGLARLPDHRLAFAGRSRLWDGGGVATVIEAPGESVDGRLWALSRADLERLDRFEGHPTWYRRRPLDVEELKGSVQREAWVYVKPRAELRAPSSRYIDQLRRAYAELELDPDALDAALSACARASSCL